VKLEAGYLTVGRFGGVVLRAHVLTLLGALVFTGFRFEPAAWLGFFVLILAHETGHAFLARRLGLRVERINLHAFGGSCEWSGETTSWQRSVVAWGGVAAQAILLGATLVLVAVLGPPRSELTGELVLVFTTTNLWIIGLNLLPFPPLDGADAWKVVAVLRSRWKSRGARKLFKLDHAPRPALSPEEARRVARAFEEALRGR
jgi:Zn-dependent protease